VTQPKFIWQKLGRHNKPLTCAIKHAWIDIRKKKPPTARLVIFSIISSQKPHIGFMMGNSDKPYLPVVGEHGLRYMRHDVQVTHWREAR
jgi:hypothetical protein